jgi:hypothetical protein
VYCTLDLAATGRLCDRDLFCTFKVRTDIAGGARIEVPEMMTEYRQYMVVERTTSPFRSVTALFWPSLARCYPISPPIRSHTPANAGLVSSSQAEPPEFQPRHPDPPSLTSPSYSPSCPPSSPPRPHRQRRPPSLLPSPPCAPSPAAP